MNLNCSLIFSEWGEWVELSYGKERYRRCLKKTLREEWSNSTQGIQQFFIFEKFF
jgi:hypothetical protein